MRGREHIWQLSEPALQARGRRFVEREASAACGKLTGGYLLTA
jgi:hypothetical protein